MSNIRLECNDEMSERAMSPTSLQCQTLLRQGFLHPKRRLRSVRALKEFARYPNAIGLEAEVAAFESEDKDAYIALIRRLAYNIFCSPNLLRKEPSELVLLSDTELASGTIVEKIQEQERQKIETFEGLLREKYDNVLKAQESTQSILACRKCGSAEVSFYQVQTRGADESSSVFCMCLNAKCKKKWRLG